MYINSHTYYSFKYGTLSVDKLLDTARQKGIKEFALTDINSTSGALLFVKESSKYDIHPILGVDFRNGTEQKFIAIAKNNQGFQEINEYLSEHLHTETNFPDRAPDFDSAFVIYPFNFSFNLSLKENEYLGVRPQDLTRLALTPWTDRLDKLVILQTVSFGDSKVSFNTHRLLRAIDQNTLLSKLPLSEQGDAEDIMYDLGKLFSFYSDYPQIIVNTKELLSACSLHFELCNPQNHQNIQSFTSSPEEDEKLLIQLCQKGITYRYGTNPSNEVINRLKKELDLIKAKQFVAYFLINWDMLVYARSKGYYYVGRGSGANSIVAYILRITDVDPIDLDLYFERFINLFRQNPPDFDVDFSWKDRDDIIRYIFERYNPRGEKPHVALLATYSTFQKRAITRELGKVFGLPPHEIDKIERTPYEEKDHIGKLISRYGEEIKNFPSHLSIHAGGILIANRPIHYFTATSLPPKGYPITHFDMILAEDVGLYKFDILSQRGLGKIKDCLEIIKTNCPDDSPIDIHDFKRFKEDPKIAEKLSKADAIGCFYIESPAMRMLMKKLQVNEYEGLVAASSIIRPGVAKSGMMREYILRYRFPERVKEAHPVLLDIMPDTYGVMVYQEDVIKVAHYFAKLTLAEADILRRGMSGKFRTQGNSFSEVRDKFFQNCNKLGHPHTVTANVWRQIESFAGYAFAKGHSASYAVESYQALFLKTYYPLEYMVAVINNGGGFYRTEFYILEARQCGAIIEAPCINHSEKLAVIQGNSIYLGLNMIKELDNSLIEKILSERIKNGIFRDFDDFIERIQASLDTLKILIRSGALRFTGLSPKELLWKAHFMMGQGVVKEKDSLFQPAIKNWALPKFEHDLREEAFDQMEFFGFPLTSPFELIQLKDQGITAKQMPNYENQKVTMIGYLVTIKKTNTSKGEYMNFGTFIDRKGHFIDTVHFPKVASKYPFRGIGIYQLKGTIVEEFDFYSLEVNRMEKIPYVNMEDIYLNVPIDAHQDEFALL